MQESAILSLGIKNTLYSAINKSAVKYNSKVYQLDSSDEFQIFKIVESLSSLFCFMFIHSSMLEFYNKDFFTRLGNFLPLILVKEDSDLDENLSFSPFNSVLQYNMLYFGLDTQIEKYILNHNDRINYLQKRLINKDIIENYTKEKTKYINLVQKHNNCLNTLNFINEFAKELYSCTKLEELFINSRSVLEKVFPLKSMHVAYWNEDYSNIQYYLGIMENDISSRIEWKKYLNSFIKPIIAKSNTENSEYIELMYTNNIDKVQNEEYPSILSSRTNIIETYSLSSLLPGNGYIVSYPLHIHGIQRGAIILDLNHKISLNEEMNNSLEIACTTFIHLFNTLHSKENNNRKSNFVSHSKRIMQQAPSIRQ